MICTSCGQAQAVLFIKTIVANKLSQQALCGDCAAESGALVKPEDALAALLKGAGTRQRAARCACGMRFADFRETGRMGCTECYRTFEAQVRALLPRMHRGAARHKGRSPGMGA